MNSADLLHEMLHGKKHLIVDGPAGSGKTHLIRQFLANKYQKVLATATTGLAASHFGGITVHSAFGLPPALTVPDLVSPPIWAAEVLQKAETLLIDEASMLLCSTLDGIDRGLQLVRGNEKAFGGLRVIFVLDHYQIPPVVSREDRLLVEQLSPDYRQPFYYFQSQVFKRKEVLGNLQVYLLTSNHRHSGDVPFKTILDRLRHGPVRQEDLAVINARAKGIMDAEGPVICMTNAAVRATNELMVLAKGTREWLVQPKLTKAVDPQHALVREHPAMDPILLQEGARVMLTRNDPKKRYVNGTLGVVAGINTDGAGQVASVVVKRDWPNQGTQSANEVVLERVPFSVFQPVFIPFHDRIVVIKVAVIQNLPLRLAYAFTSHRAQGITLPRAIVNRELGSDTPGQIYSAITRVTRLEDLVLAAPLQVKDFPPNPIVDAFLASLKEISQVVD